MDPHPDVSPTLKYSVAEYLPISISYCVNRLRPPSTIEINKKNCLLKRQLYLTDIVFSKEIIIRPGVTSLFALRTNPCR